MLRRAGDAAAATGAADGVAVIRAQCEHRISALEASSSAALREHEEKVASLTEERDDLAATVKRYKRGLLNLESKRKDEVAKLEQALRLAESGECPTPTLADYVAPALDSIRRAWSDALAGVTDARDVAARAVWSRTRSALAAGVGARARSSPARPPRRAGFPRRHAARRRSREGDGEDGRRRRHRCDRRRRHRRGDVADVVAVSRKVGPGRTDRAPVRGGRRGRGGASRGRGVGGGRRGGGVEDVPGEGTGRGPGGGLRGRRRSCSRGARGADAISAAAEAFDDKPEDFDDEEGAPRAARVAGGGGRVGRRGARDDDEDDDEEAPDPVAAEEKFVEVLRERRPRAPPPLLRDGGPRARRPDPAIPGADAPPRKSLSLSARARVERRRRRHGEAAPRRRAGPAHAPAGDGRALQPHTRLHPGSAPSASAADVLDLHSASDDLLSQHPWGDDGGDGWADAMGRARLSEEGEQARQPEVSSRWRGARRARRR